MNITVYLAVAAILIAPLVSYLAASRRLSGKIGTSDAEELWSESRSIREDYRDQIRRATQQIAELEQRFKICEDLNKKLMDENRELKDRIRNYADLQERVEHLEEENAGLKQMLETQAHATLEKLHESDGEGEKGA